MFSLVPTLDFEDLQRWFASSKKTSKFYHGYEDYFWTSGGAESLANIVEHIASSRDGVINVYLPAYFCGQSLRFLRKPNIKLCFYELNEKLLPRYSQILSASKEDRVDVLVHVHYFGNVTGQGTSRKLADKLGALLIEDCAHVISPFALKVWKGDYLIFSPHKHFPLPKVSFVISKSRHRMITSNNRDIFPLFWFFKQFFKKLKYRKSSAEWGHVWTDTAVTFNSSDINSILKRATMGYLLDFKDYAERRIQNKVNLINKFSEIKGWQPLLDEDETTVPFLLGMICDSKEIAKKRYNFLNKSFQIVMQWPDLPSEIRNTDLENESCMQVDKTLFFFTHDKIDIDRMMYEVDKLINKEGF